MKLFMYFLYIPYGYVRVLCRKPKQQSSSLLQFCTPCATREVMQYFPDRWDFTIVMWEASPNNDQYCHVFMAP
jgi:hypothetical protein